MLSRSRRSSSSISLSVGAAPLLFGAGLLFVGAGPFLLDPGSVFVIAPLVFGGDLLLFVVGQQLLLEGNLMRLDCDPIMFGVV